MAEGEGSAVPWQMTKTPPSGVLRYHYLGSLGVRAATPGVTKGLQAAHTLLFTLHKYSFEGGVMIIIPSVLEGPAEKCNLPKVAQIVNGGAQHTLSPTTGHCLTEQI